jgi:hypothetical protein
VALQNAGRNVSAANAADLISQWQVHFESYWLALDLAINERPTAVSRLALAICAHGEATDRLSYGEVRLLRSVRSALCSVLFTTFCETAECRSHGEMRCQRWQRISSPRGVLVCCSV